MPQKIAGVSGSFDDAIEAGIRNVTETLAKTTEGQQVLGGVLTWLAGGMTEGLEEGIGDLIEDIFINPVVKSGYQKDTRTAQEKWEDALQDMLVGFVSGLMGVSNLVSYNGGGKLSDTQLTTVGKQLRSLGDGTLGSDVVNALVAFGLESGQNTTSYQIASRLQRKLDSGGKVSDLEVGRLYYANIQAMEAENKTKSSVDSTGAGGYTEATDTTVSPAAGQQAQTIAQQAETVRQENPDATVTGTAVTLFLDQGLNLKTAQKRADIVARLIAGEEVTNREINVLEPTSKKTQAIFTELTGVTFPETVRSTEELYDLYRSAGAVAEAQVQAEAEAEVQAEAEAEAQAEEQVLQATQVQQDAPTRTAERILQEMGVTPNAETQARIDEATADLAARVGRLDVAADGTPLASYAEAEAAMKARMPNATPEQVRAFYQDYRNNSRTVTFAGHQLTYNQFKQLLAETESGKKLTDEQATALFNQAILDTVDGTDAFERYTGSTEEQTGAKTATTVNRGRDTLTLDNGATMTRQQFKDFFGTEVYPDMTDPQLDAMFNQMLVLGDRGERLPYDEAMAPYMREEQSNGREAEQADQEGALGDSGRVSESTGLRGETDESAGRPREGVAEGARGAEGQDGAGRDLEPGGRAESSDEGTERGDRGSVPSEQGKTGEAKEAVTEQPHEKAARELRAKKPLVKKQSVGKGLYPVKVLSKRYYTKAMRDVVTKMERVGFQGYAVMGARKLEQMRKKAAN